MTSPSRKRARNQLIFSIALLGVAIAGYLATKSYMPNTTPPETATSTVSTTTTSTPVTPAPSKSEPAVKPSGDEQAIEGTFTCLPHKNTDGPQTLECALGVKSDDGHYYALSSAGATAYSASATTPTGARVRVVGRVGVTGPGNWEQYDIVGIVEVSTFTVI